MSTLFFERSHCGLRHLRQVGMLPVFLRQQIVAANQCLKAVLEFMGCEVSSAFDGISGVALALAERPQIVLCDIGLPGIDGYEVAARLRAAMQAPLPFMIALTGYGQPEDAVRALAAGFDRHAIKPVDPETVLRLIAESRAGADRT